VPPRHWRLRVEDILTNIERIQEFTQGISLDELGRDKQRMLAVERCFEIIGEAARHVPAEIKARHPDVPWQDLREMRNVISHVYFKVSLRILWRAAREDLPPLVPQLRQLLASEKGGGSGT